MADRAPDGSENRPDVSVGKCFSDWLKKHHPNISTAFSYFIHKTPEWEGEARQYPFSALPLFREYLDTVWIPERAPDYLRTRDPAALPYLQKLLPYPSKPRPGMIKSPIPTMSAPMLSACLSRKSMKVIGEMPSGKIGAMKG